MSVAERKQAEDELVALLNRALKNVPLVKLDAVDDVLKMFTEAIDLMETHQMVVDEDERATQLQPTVAAGSSQSALLALAINPSTASTSNSSASSSDNESPDGHRANGTPFVNKSVSGLASAAMTVDYSSPSSKTRSLGAKAAPKPAAGVGLGLGLKSAGGGVGSVEKKPAVLGLGHGTHKPSSRATTGTSALATPTGSSSPVSPTTPESSNDDAPAQAAAPVLKNKLLGNVAPAREYPSPKLGPRSLTGAPRAAATPAPVVPAANPAASGLSLPAADSLGRDQPASTAVGAASPDADDEGDAEPDETEAGDLILTDKKNSVFNRVKSTLPVTASPKQIRSSFHLLELATTAGISPEDDDLTLKGQNGTGNGGPSDRAVGVLSSLPTGIQLASNNSTPKPSYLRRLDSPDTHHGQLLAAKARLQLLLNKGIQLADRVNLAMVPEIKAKLEKALAKLEASLVQATIGPQ